MRTLREANIGETVKVVKLHGDTPVKRHIMDMGITKGCSIFVRKVAPLGDPVEVTIRGYELSLRKSEAELVEIEEAISAEPIKEPVVKKQETPEAEPIEIEEKQEASE